MEPEIIFELHRPFVAHVVVPGPAQAEDGEVPEEEGEIDELSGVCFITSWRLVVSCRFVINKHWCQARPQRSQKRGRRR